MTFGDTFSLYYLYPFIDDLTNAITLITLAFVEIKKKKKDNNKNNNNNVQCQ